MLVTEAYIRRALERSEDEVKAGLVLEVLWRFTSWVELYASLVEAGSLQLGHGRGCEAAPPAMPPTGLNPDRSALLLSMVLDSKVRCVDGIQPPSRVDAFAEVSIPHLEVARWKPWTFSFDW